MSDVIKDLDHIIGSDQIKSALERDGWNSSVEEGYLMLLELLVKTTAGYYVSHTEGRFLSVFKLRNKNGQANRKGREFTKCMCYAPSNRQSHACLLAQKYRQAPISKESTNELSKVLILS